MNFDTEMQAALQTFIIESLELLEQIEEGLLSLESLEETSEQINTIFRAAHTIKGSAGLFALEHIVAFTHVIESVLDKLRAGEITVSAALIAILLPCCDHITLLIRNVDNGHFEADSALTAKGNALLAQIQPFLNAELPVKPPKARVSDDPGRIENLGSREINHGNWHLSLRFAEDSLRDGMDPLAFIRYLATLGDIVHLTTLSSSMPDAEAMDAESCYLGFEITLKSAASKAEIEGVFEFVQDNSTIHILPMNSEVEKFINLINALPEDESFLGQILVKSGALTRHELDEVLKQQASVSPEDHSTKRMGEILVEQHTVQEPIVTAALEKQKQIKSNKARENQSIRVDAERLDALIDLIGELVIAGAGVNLQALGSRETNLQEASHEMMRLVEQVRDSALQLRMVPIGTTFNRFQRVVRDVSNELGKDIELLITGGDTEVDKSVVEQISDPLTHLVRNAMDHGIETAELRLARGKPACGILKLNAYHASSTIIIEVQDDGGGLDRDKILAKGIERGLVSPGVVMSDQDVFGLIFEPGFSTAAHVSNLSGRGVGMDVVKRNVAALRGRVDVESQLGVGTTIRIHLPLTLAIIDGFMVGIAQSTFVIPLDHILECVTLPHGNEHHNYMDLRGELLPLIHLQSVFNIPGAALPRKNVVVVEYAENKAGLIVDSLLGEFQTVIKPLGKLFAHLQGIAGSTILGNGKVALIIDVAKLLNFIQRKKTSVPQLQSSPAS